MSSKPIALLGHMHVCPMVDPGSKAHVGGPIVTPGQSHVRVNGMPVAVDSGACLCTGVPVMDDHAQGSTKVRINGSGVMRMGDMTAHGGQIVMGQANIKVC